MTHALRPVITLVAIDVNDVNAPKVRLGLMTSVLHIYTAKKGCVRVPTPLLRSSMISINKTLLYLLSHWWIYDFTDLFDPAPGLVECIEY